MTNKIIEQLNKLKKSSSYINAYKKSNFVKKLRYQPPDDRSVLKYWGNVRNFKIKFSLIDKRFRTLRNNIVHKGYIPGKGETKEAVEIAKWFINEII